MPEKDRQIRFKEWGLYLNESKRPKPEQVSSSDGTLLDLEYLLRTDSAGFIMTGNDLNNAGQMRKIVLLGDSFVESLYAPETLRFSSILERNLIDEGSYYQVWNGGYSGSTLLHSFNVFMNKVVPLLRYVEKVLIFTAMSDQRTLVHNESYWMRDRTHAPLLERRNGSVMANRAPTSADQERLLRAFIGASRAFGHEPTVVTTPFRAASFADDAYTRRVHGTPETYARALGMMRLINDTARRLASDLGVAVLDAEKELGGRAEYFYDTLHLNVAGQTAMAQFLTGSLGEALSQPRISVA